MASTDSDAPYLLPPRDEELEALVGAEIVPDSPGVIRSGSVVDATVTAVADDGTLSLALPEGAAGQCGAADARPLPGELAPETGAAVRALVELELQPGRWLVSLDKARRLDRMDELDRLVREHAEIDATLTTVVRGGFSADANGIRCFVPGREAGISKEQGFAMLGQSFRFRVRSHDDRNGGLVLSRREEADRERAAAFEAAAAGLAEGQRLEGTIARLLPFGAVVELDAGVEGLLHVSELSLKHVDSPAAEVSVGQRVVVTVTGLDPQRRRINLSRRDILAAERAERLSELQVGSVHEGEVVSLSDFGAFIRISEDVEGLCHISELSWTERVDHPSLLLAVGQRVQARIIKVDADSGRISLSVRQAQDNPWTGLLDEHAIGSRITGTITRIEDYGLFIRIRDGIEGLCHVSDLTWEGRPERPSDVGDWSVGQSVDVVLLSVDMSRQRVSLGIRQLTRDPWDDAADQLVEGAIFRARVTRFDDKAAWLEIAPGLEGRLYIAEISTERVDSVRSALRLEQEVEVMTLRADRERRRIDLSIRAVEQKRLDEQPRSWDDEGPMSDLGAALRASGVVPSDEDSVNGDPTS